jgi:hypothetical protein
MKLYLIGKKYCMCTEVILLINFMSNYFLLKIQQVLHKYKIFIHGIKPFNEQSAFFMLVTSCFSHIQLQYLFSTLVSPRHSHWYYSDILDHCLSGKSLFFVLYSASYVFEWSLHAHFLHYCWLCVTSTEIKYVSSSW